MYFFQHLNLKNWRCCFILYILFRGSLQCQKCPSYRIQLACHTAYFVSISIIFQQDETLSQVRINLALWGTHSSAKWHGLPFGASANLQQQAAGGHVQETLWPSSLIQQIQLSLEKMLCQLFTPLSLQRCACEDYLAIFSRIIAVLWEVIFAASFWIHFRELPLKLFGSDSCFLSKYPILCILCRKRCCTTGQKDSKPFLWFLNLTEFFFLLQEKRWLVLIICQEIDGNYCLGT